jgi:hypothetical protein
MTRRFPIGAVAVILAALAVAAVAAAGWRSAPQADPPHLSLASKQMRVLQTQANKALIRIPNAKPGQAAQGSTMVTLAGQRATMRLRLNNVRDHPGPNGGNLVASKRLWIDVRCVAVPCPPSRVVYRGPMSDIGTRSLGTWQPGTHHTYAVRVWLRPGPTPPTNHTGDNAFQGSWARFGLVWTATAS